jgi:hypothetical protein
VQAQHALQTKSTDRPGCSPAALIPTIQGNLLELDLLKQRGKPLSVHAKIKQKIEKYHLFFAEDVLETLFPGK